METDILIPTQEKGWAIKFVDYADSLFKQPFHLTKRIAREIVKSKYWEAYDCGDQSRMEYWRVVGGCIDVLKESEIT